jgi:hypothetical protein
VAKGRREDDAGSSEGNDEMDAFERILCSTLDELSLSMNEEGEWIAAMDGSSIFRTVDKSIYMLYDAETGERYYFSATDPFHWPIVAEFKVLFEMLSEIGPSSYQEPERTQEPERVSRKKSSLPADNDAWAEMGSKRPTHQMSDGWVGKLSVAEERRLSEIFSD